MLKILNVVGTRPNFVKVAPIFRCMQADPDVQPLLIHTGQHYDRAMSEVFFEQLGLPMWDVNLGVGSSTSAVQAATIMTAFEPVLKAQQPDLVLVVGDVNSTLACAMGAAYAGIPIAHVEAGLRSFDRSMPEEINRTLTDVLAQHHFVTEASGVANLKREGITQSVHLVGNVMIDTLVHLRPQITACDVLTRLDLEPGGFGLVTLHRGENVDHPDRLREIISALDHVSQHFPLVFPIHPRTAKNAARAGVDLNPSGGIRLIEPAPYLDFLKLTHEARLVITDSGGIQEETTWLGVPCLTVRRNTERPATLDPGSNRLVPAERGAVIDAVEDILAHPNKAFSAPPLWDGRAAQRILAVLKQVL